MENRNSFTFELSETQQAALILILEGGNFKKAAVPYSIIAADGDHCRIVLYQSGKAVVQGKGAQDFVTFTLEPLVLLSAQVGYEDIINPEALAPHIGVDESGKGDFFGPMVIASAYTDKTITEQMREVGVRDSKKITSDKRIIEIAREIRKILGNRFTLIQISPGKYNQLYSKMRSVNAMLAWGHARAIENMLDIVPTCPRAISDQFGSKEQVQRALMHKGRKIELIQQHRAEADLAVAAASILAREAFVLGIKRIGDEQGVKLPKGASDLVQLAAVELINKRSPQILLETAKCHFRTTDAVLARVGQTRAVLGPAGAVVSQPYDRSKFSHSRKPSSE
ncbi:MAG: ribonuclease HIII [bacterium]